jgi:hypothetical protein
MVAGVRGKRARRISVLPRRASLPDTIPWTPLEAPPRLIRGIAEGRADPLSGRYLHAEHDADLDALAARADEIHRDDLNVIRLRR